MVINSSDEVFEELDVIVCELQLACLLFLDNFHDLVVDGSGNAALFAPFANHAVDGVDLASLAVL